MEKLEVKIVYKKKASLASFFIHNLSEVLKPACSVACKEGKKDPAPGLNIEIKYPDEDEIFGEISAANLICGKAQDGPLPFFGKSLEVDHWIELITGEF